LWQPFLQLGSEQGFLSGGAFALGMDYDALLARAKEQLPEVNEATERFEIPKVKGHVQGNATIISNFHEVADTLNRPKTHILKFLTKELAAKGAIKKDQFAIFNTKLSASRVNEKLVEYAERYVICPNCGKPDTSIEKIGQGIFLKCAACGSKSTIARTV
jgi:translation initiation factor 2 subunit 2